MSRRGTRRQGPASMSTRHRVISWHACNMTQLGICFIRYDESFVGVRPAEKKNIKILSLAFHSQGSEDLCIRAWDTRSSNSQPAFHINGFVYFPLSISVCPTDGGVYIAAGCKGFNSVGCNVKVWDIRSTNASLMADMSGHDHDVNACTFLNSSQVLSASKDGTMRLWNPQSSQDGSAETTRYCSEDNLQYTSIGYYNPGNSSSSADEPLKFVVGSFNGSLTECSFSPSTDSIEMIYQTSFNN